MLQVFSKAPPSARLGTLNETKNVNQQLEDLKGKVNTTMTKSTTEIKKFRELAKYNEQLTKSYAANLKVLMDTSALLKAYAEFFDILRERLGEVDKELGLPISGDDFDYMRQLTYDQMSNLQDAFNTEVTNLKKIYSKYGKQKEYDAVEQAEKAFASTLVSGKDALGVLSPYRGGGGSSKVAKSAARKKLNLKREKS
jgi:hypothetical protein